jgi:hypothetical protein
MSKSAGRIGGALSLLALLALVAAGLASAGSSPPPSAGAAKPGKVRRVGQSNPLAAAPAGKVHAAGYRLAASLTPSSTTSAASGRWDGVLVHTVGVVKPGSMPSIPGCSVTGRRPGGPGQSPPRASGLPYRIKCGGPVPPFVVPRGGQHWILGWRLTYKNLSSAVTGTDLRLNAPGTAGTLAATLCGPCTSGKFGRTTLTNDQADAVLNGNGYVVVRTAGNPGGEISGQILRVAPTTTH